MASEPRRLQPFFGGDWSTTRPSPGLVVPAFLDFSVTAWIDLLSVEQGYSGAGRKVALIRAYGTRGRVFHTVRKPCGKFSLLPLKKNVATPGRL